MTFDYEVCMKRDGGKAKWDGVPVKVIGEPTLWGSGAWYPLERNGAYRCAPGGELRNLDPPKPKLPKLPKLPRVDVVWRGNDPVDVYAFCVGVSAVDELRRITVDPNVLTPDELAQHGVFIERSRTGHRQSWRFWQQGIFPGDYKYATHADACRAATEWLREKGEIE